MQGKNKNKTFIATVRLDITVVATIFRFYQRQQAISPIENKNSFFSRILSDYAQLITRRETGENKIPPTIEESITLLSSVFSPSQVSNKGLLHALEQETLRVEKAEEQEILILGYLEGKGDKESKTQSLFRNACNLEEGEEEQ